MELWIRTQNRRQLLKVSAIEYIYFQGTHCLNAHNTNESDNYDIGIYKSEGRALEVLDEIQEYLMGKGLGECTTMNSVYPIILFKMPEE